MQNATKTRRTTKPSHLRHDVNHSVVAYYVDPVLLAKQARIKKQLKKNHLK